MLRQDRRALSGLPPPNSAYDGVWRLTRRSSHPVEYHDPPPACR
jgi:hypothetical protein